MEVEGILLRSNNIDLISSGQQGASQTSSYLHQSAVKANLETDMEMDKEIIRREDVERGWERKTRAAESNHRADHHPRKVTPYKEYAAPKAVEGKASTTRKPILEDEENWDEEPPLPPREALPVARPMLPSQEDEWKLMVNQDPHSRSVAGDSGHGMMAVTPKAEPVKSNEELIGAVGGINENV